MTRQAALSEIFQLDNLSVLVQLNNFPTWLETHIWGKELSTLLQLSVCSFLVRGLVESLKDGSHATRNASQDLGR